MKEILDLLKSFFDVFKQVAIVSVLVFLFLSPETIGKALDRMGIQEGDVLGFKWKRQLAATDSKLQQATDSVAELQGKLQQANQAIATQRELIVSLQAPAAATEAERQRANAITERASRLIQENSTAIQSAAQTTATVNQTLATNAALLSKGSDAPIEAPQWAIIAGGDPEESGARDELARARQAGFGSTKLFQRRGSFRTVIIFANSAAANQALRDVRTKMRRPDAYLVNLDRWCPGQREIRPDVMTCANDG